MTKYARPEDVQARMSRTMTEDERAVCGTMLGDAALLIDACAPCAALEAKKAVSCRMVVRAIGDGGESGYPLGATQGSITALGYSQSWTMGSGGSAGELYLSKADRRMLGMGNAIGSYSPVQELAPQQPEEELTDE